MGEGRGHDITRQTSPSLLAFAAFSLGVLLQFTNGSVPPGLMSRAMIGLSIVALACFAGSLAMRPASSAALDLGARKLDRFLGGLLFLQLVLFLFKRPALSLPLDDRAWVLPFATGITLVAIAAFVALRDWPRFGRWLMPTAVSVFLVLGIWTIRHTPEPGIDVITFQREGLRALSEGKNPYAITMPQVYGNQEYYGAGLTENGRLLIGHPYPPLSLLIEWPFHAATGEYRYALLAALAAAAWLLASVGRTSTGALAAVLLLFTPRSFFVVEQGWTESLVVLAIAAAVYAAIRKPAWLPLALGALFAMKQYAIFLAPIAFMLVAPVDRRKTLGILARAIAFAAAITLPFALWDLPAFHRSVVEFQFLQPFRIDSLSYLAWYARIAGSQPAAWVGFGAMLAALVVVLWRSPRTPAGFAAGGATILFAFFAFNKQAFCNYYFVVVGALWCAVAAQKPRV
jgi:hypothetical protein